LVAALPRWALRAFCVKSPLALPTLYFIPKLVQLRQVQLLQVDSALAGERFYLAENGRRNLCVGALQRRFAVDFQFAREVDDGEKQVADFLLEGARPRPGGAQSSASTSASSLTNLGHDRRGLAPVETDAGRFLLHFFPRAISAGSPPEMPSRAEVAATPFSARLISSHLRSTSAESAQRSSPKTWGMPPEQFLDDAPGDVIEIEASFLGGDLRMKNRLQQKIAQFLAKIGVVVLIDRLDDFVRFLDQARAQAGVRLLPVPRAAIRGAQPRDDGAQLLNGRLGGVRKFRI